MRTIRKTFKYRLYPKPEQVEKLQWILDRCRELYNAGLEERISIYKRTGKTQTAFAQMKQLPAIKKDNPEFKEIAAHVLQDVFTRLDKAYQAFFRRIKEKKGNAGFPRFQGRDRYDSFTFPDQWGWKQEDKKLSISKIGEIKIKLHRPIEGQIKTVTIKREGRHWYACLSCAIEVPDIILAEGGESIGIDVGLTTFATLSNGEKIENPRYLRRGMKNLKTKQQKLSRCKKGSHRRSRAKQEVGKAHRKVRNQRQDFLNKESRKLVERYDVIVLEDLKVKNMVKNHHLALSISDAGWGIFRQLLEVKAGWAGRWVIVVDPKYTSQICSGCGKRKKKLLSERCHECACGTSLDRDHNAAQNILRLGHSQQHLGAVEAAR